MERPDGSRGASEYGERGLWWQRSRTTTMEGAAARELQTGVGGPSPGVWMYCTAASGRFELRLMVNQGAQMHCDFPAAVPEIPVSDVGKAAEYYVKNLGFKIDW